jgi:hypothetical protein
MFSGSGGVLRGVKGVAIAESVAALDAPQVLPYPLSMGVRGAALPPRAVDYEMFPTGRVKPF